MISNREERNIIVFPTEGDVNTGNGYKHIGRAEEQKRKKTAAG